MRIKNNPFIYFIVGSSTFLIYWLPLLFKHLKSEYVWNNWLSDYTIYLQMAEDIIKGDKFPFYYYGQNYMGPLTSLVIAIWQIIINLFNTSLEVPFFGGTYTVSIYAGILATFSMSALGLLIWGWFACKTFSPIVGLIFLTIGLTHGYFQTLFFRPNGPEMVLFLSSLIIYFYKITIEKPSSLKRFLLGLLLSISIWMNQTLVFLILAIFISHLLEMYSIKEIICRLELKNRFSFKKYNLDSKNNSFLRIIQSLIFINAGIGFLVLIPGEIDFSLNSLHIKMNNGLSPILTSSFLLLILHVLLEYNFNQKFFLNIFNLLNPLKYLMIGFIIGQIPLKLGKIFGIIPSYYSVKLKPVALVHLSEYLYKLASDFFPRFFDGGTKNSSYPTLGLIFFIIFAFHLFSMRKLFFSKHSFYRILGLTLLLNFVFIAFVDRARTEYADRYLVLFHILVPLIIAIFVNQYKTAKYQFIPFFLVLFMAIAWVPAGYSNMNEYLLKNDSPINELKKLKESGYKICYANYWDAYRLNYFSGNNIKFIPYLSQDRTPELSKKLKETTEKKCLYSKSEPLIEAPEELSKSP